MEHIVFKRSSLLVCQLPNDSPLLCITVTKNTVLGMVDVKKGICSLIWKEFSEVKM